MFRYFILLAIGLGLAFYLSGVGSPDVSTGAVTAADPVPAKAKDREISVENELYTLEYAYPAEAAAVPALEAILKERLERARAEIEANAAESKQDAEANGYPFRAHALDTGWTVLADLPGWLSLQADIYSYGGGAHGNQGFDSLLWDRKSAKERKPLDLFASAAGLEAALRDRYCAALDAERAERREQSIEEVRQDDFWKCPGIEELTLALGSAGGKRFDRLLLLAAPYVAGAYVEGSYAVELPVDKAILATVAPAFREAFEAKSP